jgi:hypothetical protein
MFDASTVRLGLNGLGARGGTQLQSPTPLQLCAAVSRRLRSVRAATDPG